LFMTFSAIDIHQKLIYSIIFMNRKLHMKEMFKGIISLDVKLKGETHVLVPACGEDVLVCSPVIQQRPFQYKQGESNRTGRICI